MVGRCWLDGWDSCIGCQGGDNKGHYFILRADFVWGQCTLSFAAMTFPSSCKKWFILNYEGIKYHTYLSENQLNSKTVLTIVWHVLTRDSASVMVGLDNPWGRTGRTINWLRYNVSGMYVVLLDNNMKKNTPISLFWRSNTNWCIGQPLYQRS